MGIFGDDNICILCGESVDYSGEFGDYGFPTADGPVHETCHLKEKIKLLHYELGMAHDELAKAYAKIVEHESRP